jgi:hypothetical protein
VRLVQELLLFIVIVAAEFIWIAPNAVLDEPLMVFVAPENVVLFTAALSVPPLFVQLPATVIFPTSVCVPPVKVTFPNVIAAVGVIVEEAVKFTVLVALKVTAVVLTVKLPPKVIVSPARVVNVPPDFVYPPLKRNVPAVVVFLIVPPVWVMSPAKVTLPVLVTVIKPPAKVKPVAFVNEAVPVETVTD